MLSHILSRYWWATLLRGVAWVLFGLVVFAWPGISLLTLTLLFGVFALADGLGSIAAAFGGRHESETWWVLLLAGGAGICAAVITFLSPGVTAVTLLFLIALWAIARGLSRSRHRGRTAKGYRRRVVARTRRPHLDCLRRVPPRATGDRCARGVVGDRRLCRRLWRDLHCPGVRSADAFPQRHQGVNDRRTSFTHRNPRWFVPVRLRRKGQESVLSLVPRGRESIASGPVTR